jgi:hypothetical protein
MIRGRLWELLDEAALSKIDAAAVRLLEQSGCAGNATAGIFEMGSSLEKSFLKDGGFTERMYQARSEARRAPPPGGAAGPRGEGRQS